MVKCPLCGGNEWDKGTIECGEIAERYIRFFSKNKKETGIIAMIHGMLCLNCGYVLTFIGEENLP